MKSPVTILFADDDQDDLDLLKEVLTEVAPTHILHYVNHGDNVLESVKKNLPDLIFLDYNLVTVITGGSYNTQSFSDELIRKYILPAFNRK